MYVVKSHVLLCCVNNLKTNINLSYIERFCSYRGVNTLRLSYKSQSINAV